MFGGVCFMVNDKMCVGVVKDEMMCRMNPTMDEIVLEMNDCRQMDFTSKPMKGYVYVSDDGMKKKKHLNIGLACAWSLMRKLKRARRRRKK